MSSRVVPGTGAPGCTGVRLYAVGRRTHVLGARSVHHPVSSRLSVSSGHCLELRVSPLSATRILPSGLSPSVPGFHRLSRWFPGCLTLPWHERVADCDRRFGLSPSVPEFHRLSRRAHSRFRRVWCERVADCDRRFGLSPTPEHVADGKSTTSIATRPLCCGDHHPGHDSTVVDLSRHDDDREGPSPTVPVGYEREAATAASNSSEISLDG